MVYIPNKPYLNNFDRSHKVLQDVDRASQQTGKLISYLYCMNAFLILAIDFPGGKRNRNIKIRAQLRILKCIAIVKEASQNVLKHIY